MTALRWLTIAGLGVLIIFGALRVRDRPPHWPPTYRGHWRAGRPMATGDQLRAGDLREPDDPVARVRLDTVNLIVGRHLLVPREQGDRVTVDDVTLWPAIAPPGAGHVQFVVRTGPLDAPIAFAADTTRTVFGCYASTASAFRCSCTPLVILRMNKPVANDSGWVVLEGDRSPDVVEFLGAARRELVRARPCPAPKPPKTHRSSCAGTRPAHEG
jgi:hypothetical protein